MVTGRASAGESVRDRHHVCLVVPNGTHRPGALAAAVAHHHPDVQIGAIWCGDPQLRPADDGVPWCDIDRSGGSSTADAEWHHALLTSSPLDLEWRGALRAAALLLHDGAHSVTLLWVGAVAVLDDISTMWAAPESAFTLVPRVGPLPNDGATPDERSLAEEGMFNVHVATFGRGSLDVIEWLTERLEDDAIAVSHDGDPAQEVLSVGVARWLEVAASMFGAARCDDERIGVGAWRWSTERPALLDAPGYDPETPWVLDRHIGHRSRTVIVGHVDRRAALDAAAEQLAGERTALTAPGGIAIDDAVRRVACSARIPPPSPWSDPSGFRSWLADRYWAELHATRRDLVATFPLPTTDDAPAFRDWSRRAVVDDDVALLVPPVQPGRPAAIQFDTPEILRDDGINLAGYFRRESSLGDVGRRLASALAAAEVPTSLLAHERTGSPILAHPPEVSRRIEFTTTLAVINADQFATLEADHPELLAATQRMIGYWFWELELIPPAMQAVFPLVHEIWAGSQFVVDAFAAVASVPVRHVPIPVARPVASNMSRPSFARLAPIGDRFMFAVVFDHFSVTERKNPIGAIHAFRRAFAPDEGPVLVVKTMNGERRWPQHQQVLAAAEGRDDIIVWDEHLTRPDHMSFIAAADALVSLHRSEGLGLHLAEAMWLETATIATRYSGNLDFMDDDCALLVDYQLVPVQGGEGVYPPNAVWADPDLDVAAEAMRRLASDPALRARLAAAGRSKMEAQPSLVQTGRLVAELLGLQGT